MRIFRRVLLFLPLIFLLSSCGDSSVELSARDSLFDFDAEERTETVSAEVGEKSGYCSAAEAAVNDPVYRAILSKYGDEEDAVSVLAAFLEYLGYLEYPDTDPVEKTPEATDAENGTESTVISDRGMPTGETVFWTQNGSVWHTRRDCPSLAKSSEILSGTVADAEQAGKERVCKRCDPAG